MQYRARAAFVALHCLALVGWGCAPETGTPGTSRGGGPADPSGPDGPRDPGDPGPGRGYDGGTCDSITVDARQEPSTVLIVLDRSGSMYDIDYGGPDRWTPSVRAIESVSTALDDRLELGLMLFASDDDCGVGRVRVTPALGGAAAIGSALAGDPYDSTGGGTPTAASLDAALAALAGVAGTRSVLLVTDGAPNCNEALDDRTCRCTSGEADCSGWPGDCLDDARSVAAVRALREAGISTYVVGYDTGEWADVMDRMAAEGGTAFTRHLQVTDRASLEAALRDIGGSVASCSFDLGEPPGDIRYVRVTVDDGTVDHESVSADGSGWRLEGDRTITLLGPDCARVQDGADHRISVVVECSPVII